MYNAGVDNSCCSLLEMRKTNNYKPSINLYIFILSKKDKKTTNLSASSVFMSISIACVPTSSRNFCKEKQSRYNTLYLS